jgi:predicted  nucleic acid-binding Zn-ribbon protein
LAVATAAGAYFAFKTSKNTQLIQVYQGTANAWQERAAAYADQIKELQSQNQEQATKIADLQGQVSMLKDMATGRQTIGQLLEKVDRIQTLLEGRPHV